MLFIFRILLGILLLSQTGCLTYGTWQSATKPNLDFAGVSMGQGEGNGGPHLAAEYSLSGHDLSRYFRIPIDSSGTISSPLGYSGTATSIADLETKLSSDQNHAVESYVFDERNAVDAKTIRTDWQPEFRASYGIQFERSRIHVVGLDSKGMPVEIVPSRTEQFRKSPFSEDVANLILIPSTRPRQKSERNRSIAVAALVTPLTLVADLVVTPLFWFGMATHTIG